MLLGTPTITRTSAAIRKTVEASKTRSTPWVNSAALAVALTCEVALANTVTSTATPRARADLLHDVHQTGGRSGISRLNPGQGGLGQCDEGDAVADAEQHQAEQHLGVGRVLTESTEEEDRDG